MPILKVDLNLSQDVLDAIHAHRGAMPVPDFLAHAVKFGVQDIRDGDQQQGRDYDTRTFEEQRAKYNRQNVAPDLHPGLANNVINLAE